MKLISTAFSTLVAAVVAVPLPARAGLLCAPSSTHRSIATRGTSTPCTTRKSATATPQTIVTDDGAAAGESRRRNRSDAAKRFGQVTSMHIECISWETLDGALVRFECTTRSGPTPQTVRGRCEPGKVVIARRPTRGARRSCRCPTRAKLGGFNAVDQSLAPVADDAGETRSVESLWPVINQPATTTLVAKDFEPTELLTRHLRAAADRRDDGRSWLAADRLDALERSQRRSAEEPHRRVRSDRLPHESRLLLGQPCRRRRSTSATRRS